MGVRIRRQYIAGTAEVGRFRDRDERDEIGLGMSRAGMQGMLGGGY